MYFTVGWPRILRVPEVESGGLVTQVVANRDKIIFALLTNSTLSIWTSKPCLPIVSHHRSSASVTKLGRNVEIVWKPDSSRVVVVTSGGYLIFYKFSTGSKNAYEQMDPENSKLKRESDELFLKESIPDMTLEMMKEIAVAGDVVGAITLFREELMVSTNQNHIIRYRWDGTINNDYCIDLRRIPFSVDQQASRAVPVVEPNVYPVNLHYSPLVGGFSLVLSDGRAAFLTASTKVYDPNSVQGIWAPNIDDATCSTVNHKYRLISFGRRNAQTAVYIVEDQTGALQNLFNLKLSSRDFPGSPGPVQAMAWTPDGCAIAVSWEKGGYALWSVFGSLLTCSWSWTGDLTSNAQKIVRSLDWSAEGYQLWMAVQPSSVDRPDHSLSSGASSSSSSSVYSVLGDQFSSCGLFGIVSFVKSALTVNPSMSKTEHLYLQGEDRLLISFNADSCMNSAAGNGGKPVSNKQVKTEVVNPLGNNKNWVIVPVPNNYLATNWPIRYSAMDPEGLHVAVSGRFGLAHYSLAERKWKLFGNEAQERDFVVVGGMMWWDAYLVVAVYDLAQDRDELRFYPRDSKLDNKFAYTKRLPNQILLLSLDRNKLLVFAADATLAIFQLRNDLKPEAVNPASIDPCDCIQTIDISALCVHPACVVSIYLTTLKTSFTSTEEQHSVVLNVSGRLMILHHEFLVQENNEGNVPQYITPTVLASCVEMIWLPRASQSSGSSNHNPYLSEALWLYCGQEMRVWLPLREKSQSSVHTFISNRIMLGFPVSIYPLTILFEKAIILGAENDSLSYATGTPNSPDPYGAPNALFPFCILQRTSQVYLHQILRQLIRRNLGYYAWEIARSCSKLPYFPHSLELLLHEVLEEEATSKEPIPDALLPSIIEFVREFPVYLRAVGQCARKTELALWPHLFSVAGRPRALFDECLQRGQLDIAATYLLVIQNLESPVVSRKFATQLMDRALENRKWDLVKDLVRFLKAIDPSEATEPHRSSIVKFNMQSPPVSPSEYDISMVLGTMQVPRFRSFSTSQAPKFPDVTSTAPHRELSRTNSDTRGSAPGISSPTQASTSSGSNINPSQISPSIAHHAHQAATSQFSIPPNFSAEMPTISLNSEFQHYGSGDDGGSMGAMYVDTIVEKHARRILSEGKLRDLGKLAAHLDFYLVTWLVKEKRRRTTTVSDYVAALKMIHSEFEWPYPDLAVHSHHSRTPSTDSIKFQTPEGASPLKPLIVDVSGRPGTGSKNGIDSGYNSVPGNNPIEARLLPNTLNAHGHDFDTLSILSEESLMVDHSPITPSDYYPSFGISDSTKLSLMNSSKRGIELRFMQQIMWEAGVLDWSLLISIALRDAIGVVRTVNSSREESPDCIRNLRDGLMNLALWANTQCMGYRGFISAINTQVGGLLSKFLAAATHQHGPSSPGGGHVTLAEMNRRKTEPSLQLTRPKMLAHHDSMPASTNSPPDSSTRKAGPSSSANTGRRSSSSSLNSPPDAKTDKRLSETKLNANDNTSDSDHSHSHSPSLGYNNRTEVAEPDEPENQSSCIIV